MNQIEIGQRTFHGRMEIIRVNVPNVKKNLTDISADCFVRYAIKSLQSLFRGLPN